MGKNRILKMEIQKKERKKRDNKHDKIMYFVCL